MYSASYFSPQVAAPLSQIVSIWHRAASRFNRASQPASQKAEITITTQCPDVISNQHIAKELKSVLSDTSLADVAEHVRVESIFDPTLAPLVQSTPLGELHWVSAESFFENKSGFKEQELSDTGYERSVTERTIQISLPIKRLLTTLHISQPLFQQTRGFKTKRGETTGGFAHKPKEPFTFKLQQKTSRNDTTDAINKMLDFSKSERIAYKLGYETHKGEPPKDSAQKPEDGVKKWLGRGSSIAFTCLMVYLVYSLMSKVEIRGGVQSVLNPKVDEINPETVKVRFSDVKGCDEVKEELIDIVRFLKHPEKFDDMGARLPKGVLLVGVPGIGKTLLAKAVAGEAGVPFFQSSGSEFDEIFVGTGAKKIRTLFEKARQRAPCVVFIDEIDSVGAKRTNSQIHPYANQTINQLLSEMDGFNTGEGVIVLGATNKVENLDKALLRPGRFDIRIKVNLPDKDGRAEILKHYLDKVKNKDIDIDGFAKRTVGFSGAELENMINQGALKAVLDDKIYVTNEDIEWAKDKIIMGPAKKSKIPDEETNQNTAYHEAGHTLVAFYTPEATPIHKVTILPRGDSLGHTAFSPDKDRWGSTKAELKAQLDVAMGGRVAEELMFGDEKVTTGASSDFAQATAIAESMVRDFGMSKKVGHRTLRDDQVKLGGMEDVVDTEIKRLLDESYARAKALLEEHRSELEILCKALLEFETLDLNDVKLLIKTKRLTGIEKARNERKVTVINSPVTSVIKDGKTGLFNWAPVKSE